MSVMSIILVDDTNIIDKTHTNSAHGNDDYTNVIDKTNIPHNSSLGNSVSNSSNNSSRKDNDKDKNDHDNKHASIEKELPEGLKPMEYNYGETIRFDVYKNLIITLQI